MSWEEAISYRSCECGKGKVQVTNRMDDWNRSEYSEIILCEECKERERRQQEYENKRELKFKEQEEIVLNYFNLNYLEKWLDYFSEMRCKNEIWTVVHNAKIEICCLKTFYEHLKSYRTREDYIKRLITFDKIPNIIGLLEINDDKLNEMLKEPMNYYNERERKRWNEAYRNRK